MLEVGRESLKSLESVLILCSVGQDDAGGGAGEPEEPGVCAG
jgi:hypothetical protein